MEKGVGFHRKATLCEGDKQAVLNFKYYFILSIYSYIFLFI